MGKQKFPREMKLTYLLPDASKIELTWEPYRTIDVEMPYTLSDGSIVRAFLLSAVRTGA